MINKKVLITGDRGFLGRHLKKKLSYLGWEISVSNTSIANLENEKNLHIYNEIKFDYIFHLAAHTKAGDYCLYHKGDQFEINQTINTNILKYWKNYQPQAKMIAMGTSCSYCPEKIMSEENYLIGEPEEGLYTYAMTKRMLLIGLKSYAEQYGLKYIYYIPSTLYGPLFNLDDSHFIFDLIKKIYDGKKNGSKVELWGDGNQKRELIYIDDAVNIMLDTLNCENNIFNLGTGIEHSIKEYANIISKILNYDENKIIYDTTKYVGVLSKKLSVFKLQKTIPNIGFVDINEGINSTINFYKTQKENVK